VRPCWDRRRHCRVHGSRNGHPAKIVILLLLLLLSQFHGQINERHIYCFRDSLFQKLVNVDLKTFLGLFLANALCLYFNPPFL
jgi:hypothetical protein